ncbi:MAG: ankyrin repeat domain-containing protein [Rickettsiaceae bacterium]|nr:ankyrin repeat domain-containing protein [Rickettsiaceae bacterium]
MNNKKLLLLKVHPAKRDVSTSSLKPYFSEIETDGYESEEEYVFTFEHSLRPQFKDSFKFYGDEAREGDFSEKDGNKFFNIITPLQRAVLKGDLAMAEKCITNGENVNEENIIPKKMFKSLSIDEETLSLPLHIAVALGNLKMVKLLLSSGADINAKTRHGETALYIAIYRQNLEMTKLLLDNSASINLHNNDGYSLLHIAGSHTNHLITSELINRGADCSFKSTNTNTTPLESILYSRSSVDNIEVLLQNTPKLPGNKVSATCVMIIKNNPNNTKILKKFLSYYPITELEIDYVDIILGLASALHSYKGVKLLLENGAKPDIKSNGEYFAFGSVDLRVEYIKPEIRYLFKQYGAEASQLNSGVKTLEHEIVLSSKYSFIKKLLDSGLDVETYTDRSQEFKLLDLACFNGRADVAELLIDHGANFERNNFQSFWIALTRKCFNVVDMLVEKFTSFKLDINQYAKKAMYFGYCSYHSDLMVNYLLKKGFDPKTPITDDNKNLCELLLTDTNTDPFREVITDCWHRARNNRGYVNETYLHQKGSSKKSKNQVGVKEMCEDIIRWEQEDANEGMLSLIQGSDEIWDDNGGMLAFMLDPADILDP